MEKVSFSAFQLRGAGGIVFHKTSSFVCFAQFYVEQKILWQAYRMARPGLKQHSHESLEGWAIEIRLRLDWISSPTPYNEGVKLALILFSLINSAETFLLWQRQRDRLIFIDPLSSWVYEKHPSHNEYNDRSYFKFHLFTNKKLSRFQGERNSRGYTEWPMILQEVRDFPGGAADAAVCWWVDLFDIQQISSDQRESNG